MGEQSNAYRILLRYDRKSRHRRIKKQRRYERLAATSQFLYCQMPFRAGIARTIGYRIPIALHLTERFSAEVEARSHLWMADRDPKGIPINIPRTRCNAKTRFWLLGVTKLQPLFQGQWANPCGNFSGTSSLKFRGTKGSIGHTFMVCIHTENQNQGDFYPFVLLEISVLHESPLGHLRYGLTDVPPQPNSPPDNVFNPDRPARDLNARSWAVKPSSASLNK